MAQSDIYTNNEQDWYPGARQRSRPGQAPHEPIYDTVIDANGRRVVDKPANRAILASQRRRAEHEAKVSEQRERKRQSTPTSSSSSSSSSSSISFRPLLPFFLFLPLLSSFLTQSYTFNLSPYIIPPVQKYWATTSLNPWKEEMKVFTPLQLAMYDGTDPELPVYLAIDGDVFDVSANRRIYGAGGSYNMMAGRDASRAFTTGCFETHLTHDTRGLSTDELASLQHWKSFFSKHEKYRKIGTVINPPIKASTPIPPPCKIADAEAESEADSGSGSAQHAPGEKAANAGKSKPGPVHVHGK